MKNCEKLLENICDYIDNEMSKEQCKIFIKHLNECKECRDIVEELKQIKELCKESKVNMPENMKLKLKEFFNKNIN